jgi:hypothetical protein
MGTLNSCPNDGGDRGRSGDTALKGGATPSLQFVVLGVHRSGTSLVAGVLERLGVHMGTPPGGRRWPTSWGNPTGHIEDGDFLWLNRRLLGMDNGRPADRPRTQVKAVVTPDLRQEMRRLIARREGVWGWKDPWTVLTVEEYLAELSDPRFIVCRRDRTAMLASLARHEELYSEVVSLLPRFDDRLASLTGTLASYPVLEVQYEDLIQNPTVEVERIAKWTGLDVTGSQLREAHGLVLSAHDLDHARRAGALGSLLRFPLRLAGRPPPLLGFGSTTANAANLAQLPRSAARALIALVQSVESPPVRRDRRAIDAKLIEREATELPQT